MKEKLASSVSILTLPEIKLDSLAVLHLKFTISKEMERNICTVGFQYKLKYFH